MRYIGTIESVYVTQYLKDSALWARRDARLRRVRNLAVLTGLIIIVALLARHG